MREINVLEINKVMQRPPFLPDQNCVLYLYCGLYNAQIPLDTFLSSFPVDGEVANLLLACCGLVSDTANYLDMSR